MDENATNSAVDGGSREQAVSTGDDGGTDVSTRVVLAVADHEGVDPTEMERPLNDWIDPDALDALVRSMDQGHVEFAVLGHRIRVRADGSVVVGRSG